MWTERSIWDERPRNDGARPGPPVSRRTFLGGWAGVVSATIGVTAAGGRGETPTAGEPWSDGTLWDDHTPWVC